MDYTYMFLSTQYIQVMGVITRSVNDNTETKYFVEDKKIQEVQDLTMISKIEDIKLHVR